MYSLELFAETLAKADKNVLPTIYIRHNTCNYSMIYVMTNQLNRIGLCGRGKWEIEKSLLPKELNLQLRKGVSDCCLMPNQMSYFFSYIMARTSYIPRRR